MAAPSRIWIHTDASPVRAILPEPDSVWVGTDDGLVHYTGDPPRARAYGVSDGVPAMPVTAIARDAGGTLWIGNAQGLRRMVGEVFEPARGVLSEGSRVSSLLTGPTGSLWVGGAFGLLRGQGQADFLRLNRDVQVLAMALDGGGEPWICTEWHGVLHFSDGALQKFGRRHGLGSHGCSSISVGPSGMIVVTGAGAEKDTLSVFVEGVWYPYQLVEDAVRWDLLGLVADERGHLLRTHFGVYRLRRLKLPEHADQRRLLLAELEGRAPAIRPLSIPTGQAVATDSRPKASPDAQASASRALGTDLPPLPSIPDPGSGQRETYNQLRRETLRGRASYQRAAADYAALQAELQVLLVRRDERRAEIPGLEKRLRNARAARHTQGGGPETVQTLEDALAQAQEAIRGAGVGFELMAARVRSAGEEKKRTRLDALAAQGRYIASFGGASADADDEAKPQTVGVTEAGPAPDKLLSGVSKLGVEEPMASIDAPVPVRPASIPRRDAALPRFLLTPADDVATVSPGAMSAWRFTSSGLWSGSLHAGLMNHSGVGKRHFRANNLVPSTANLGPIDDKEGRVWVASGGQSFAHRFDGRRWHRVSLPGPEALVGLATDPTGGLWALSQDSQGGFRGYASVEGKFELKAQWGMPVGAPADLRVAALDVGLHGRLWLALEVPRPNGRARPQGILEIPADGSEVRHHRMDSTRRFPDTGPGFELPSDRVNQVTATDSLTWLATGSGLCRLGEDRIEVYGENEGLETEVIRSLALDEQDGIWIATAAGVAYLKPQGTWYLSGVNTGLPTLDVRSLAIAPGGEIWALTARGLAVLFPEAKRWAKPDALRGVPINEVLSVTVDSKGRAWLRTDSALYMREL